MKIKIIAGLSLAFLFATSGWGNANWVLDKESLGIKTYTKKIAGSKYLAFKGVLTMEATIDQLVSVMRDIPSMEGWLHTSYDLILVSSESETSRIIYMKIHTPTFLVAERDLVLRQEIKRVRPDYAYIQLIAVPGAADVLDDYMRISGFSGRWDFEKISDEHVKVTYEGMVDPGGYLPAVIANLMVTETPYETLRKLNKHIKMMYGVN